MSATAEQRERIRRIIRDNLGVLNRLESHLGCVICRGPLTDGVCPQDHETLAATEEPDAT